MKSPSQNEGAFSINAGRSFRQSLFAMMGISSVVVMVAIDQTVVGTALPTIVAELKGFQYYAWVATAYLLTSVITVPVFGRLGDWFGRKPFVVAAIVLFTGASALCGLAGSMFELVAFRALQGIGGGMLVGTAFASIPDLFPDPVRRLRWQVLFSSAFGLANAIGPSLGGLLTQHYGWRFVFLVNLPVGLVGLYFTARHLPHIRHQQAGRFSLDWIGAALIAATLGSMQLLVESMASEGLSRKNLELAAVMLISGALLVRQERRAAQPIVPPALVRNRAVATLWVLSILMGMAMFSLLFYVPLLLQGGMEMLPDAAGFFVTPLVFCIAVGTVTNTQIVTRLKNPNVLLYVGFSMLACACGGVALVNSMHDKAMLIASMFAGGVGIGFIMPNLTVFAQQVAGKLQLGIATALIQSARMVGGMIGMAIVGTIVHVKYVRGIVDLLGAQANAPWAGAVLNPQLLVSQAQTVRFLQTTADAGIAGGKVVTAARLLLISAVNDAEMAVTALMLIALVGVWLLPLIRLSTHQDVALSAPE